MVVPDDLFYDPEDPALAPLGRSEPRRLQPPLVVRQLQHFISALASPEARTRLANFGTRRGESRPSRLDSSQRVVILTAVGFAVDCPVRGRALGPHEHVRLSSATAGVVSREPARDDDGRAAPHGRDSGPLPLRPFLDVDHYGAWVQATEPPEDLGLESPAPLYPTLGYWGAGQRLQGSSTSHWARTGQRDAT